MSRKDQFTPELRKNARDLFTDFIALLDDWDNLTEDQIGVKITDLVERLEFLEQMIQL